MTERKTSARPLPAPHVGADRPTPGQPPPERAAPVRGISVHPVSVRPRGKPLPQNVRRARAAFDLLHLRHAADFTRQAYLLCGHPALAEQAVTHAFRTAWAKWPEVTSDGDPAGWIRAAAHDRALAPWHRLTHPPANRPPHPGPAADRELLAGLLALPRPYRRTLLLHDGLGLESTAIAVETEASAAAARGRIAHAREALSALVPELETAPAACRTALLTRRLRLLLTAATVPTPPPAARVRTECERCVRRRTAAACGLTAVIAAAVALSWVSPERADREPAGASAVSARSHTADVAPRRAGPAHLPSLRSTNTRMRLLVRDGQATAVPLRKR